MHFKSIDFISNLKHVEACLSYMDDALFEDIACDLDAQGFSIRPAGVPEELAQSLMQYQATMTAGQYQRAGVGRHDEFLMNKAVRTDEIAWIDGESEVGKRWLAWAAELQQFLNRRLYLGLFSFESHFAHYGPGEYYKTHYDAFHGQTNRVLSVVTYLNQDWSVADGGELVLYLNDDDKTGIRVLPCLGTLVVFLSEEFPHEVLPASRDRYSIAGWFRVNTSVSDRVDPPR